MFDGEVGVGEDTGGAEDGVGWGGLCVEGWGGGEDGQSGDEVASVHAGEFYRLEVKVGRVVSVCEIPTLSMKLKGWGHPQGLGVCSWNPCLRFETWGTRRGGSMG